MKKLLSILLIFFINYSIHSQRETDNWYFGDKAGINFNQPSPSIQYSGEMETPAGCSSISDDQGNLLFYTNGQTVWNKNHQVMENGEGLTGEIENSQSTIIIPKPNSTSIYYLISTRNNSSSTPISYPGIYYSEIEISNLFPLGKVINKNALLRNSQSSRVTGIHHNDGKSIWLITFGSATSITGSENNTFKNYKIDETGINTIPIISEQNEIDHGEGVLKISPDGKTLALADYNGIFIHLYNFNSANGEIDFRTKFGASPGILEFVSAYGIDFSQDSKFLYFTGNSISKSYLYQYELNTSNLDPRTKLAESTIYNYKSVQLSSNGKIYISKTDINNNTQEFLDVINQPEKNGIECRFAHNAVNLLPSTTNKGLPNFIQSYFRNRIVIENNCVSEVFKFNTDTFASITAVSWDFGDGNTSTEFEPTHLFNTPGTYLITANITYNSITAPIYKEIEVYPLPEVKPNQELIQCDINNDGVDYFDLNDIGIKTVENFSNETFLFYRSLLDAQNDENKIPNPEAFENETNPQELFVRVLSEKGCVSITNFFIESKFVQLGNISDLYSCDSSDQINDDLKGSFDLREKRRQIRSNYNLNNGETIRFFPSLIEAQTTANLIDDSFTTSTTTIFVRVDTDLGCGGIEPLNLFVNSPIITNINDNYTICNQPTLHTSIILDGNSLNDRFEWKNEFGDIISTNREFTLTETGTFSLTVYKTANGIECSNSKEFTVVNPIGPTLNQVIIDTESENNLVYVSVIGSNSNSSYQFSLDNENFYGNGLNYLFNNVEPGIKTIYINDIKNCESSLETEVAVIGFPKFLTPNSDGNNDTWSVKGATTDFFKNVDIYIFDRYGKTIHTINLTNQQNGWDGTFNGIKLPARNYWYKAILVDNNDNKIERTGSIGLIR